jgi:hypothetical protein
MRELGDNLSNYPNVDFIETTDANELKSLLMAIRYPYRILAIYSLGQRHYAWLAPSRPITIKTTKGKVTDK